MTGLKVIICRLRIHYLSLALGFSSTAMAEDGFHAGPVFDHFSLTLSLGHRAEAVGPFFYNQLSDTEKTWAVPPLLSYDTDPTTETKEFDLLYPVLTCERFGTEYRWQLGQLLSFSGGQNPDDDLPVSKFTIFPLYFQQRSPNPELNYTALVPVYGHIQGRLFRNEIFFVLFPLYVETQKRDVVTDNYLFPIFHLRHGDGLHGWQVWPLAGSEHKSVTTQTNGFGETEVVGGHDSFFALWPVYLRQNNNLGTDNPEKFRAVIPFYVRSRSPKRDFTSVIWPLFNWIDDRENKYREWEGPFPFVVIARGEGKTTTRFWPLFSQAHSAVAEENYYVWPLYKYNRFHTGVLDQNRTRILFYLFSDVEERNTETGKSLRRIDLWPLFTYHRGFNGNRWLQIIAPVEVALPNNRGVERNWAPLWSLWRSEANSGTGASSQSLLWNLYRRDTAPAAKKCSLLFGFFQYQSDSKMNKLRLLYIPVLAWHTPAGAVN